MAWFRCLVRGENFSGEMIGQAGLVGFYITRFVDADSAEAAESMILQSLRSEAKLIPPPSFVPSEATRVYFEKIEKVKAKDVPSEELGFAWFPMEPKS